MHALKYCCILKIYLRIASREKIVGVENLSEVLANNVQFYSYLVVCARLTLGRHIFAIILKMHTFKSYSSKKKKPIASIWRENSLGYLFADIVCSEKQSAI